VFVQLKASTTAASAQAFLRALHKACPIRITKLLTARVRHQTLQVIDLLEVAV